MACCFGKKTKEGEAADGERLPLHVEGAKPPQFEEGAGAKVDVNGATTNPAWLDAAIKSVSEEAGYVEHDGALLLCQASKKYKKKVTLPIDTPDENISFCEKKAWYTTSI